MKNGSVSIKVSQTGNTTYFTPIEKSLTIIAKLQAVLTNTSINPVNIIAGSTPIDLSQYITSNHTESTIIYESSDSSIASISGSILTPVENKAGTVLISISQIETSDYLSITSSIHIRQRIQTVLTNTARYLKPYKTV